MIKQRFMRRLSEIRALLTERQLDGIILQHQKNVSWLMGGRSHVNTASEPACCQFVVTGTDCILVANNYELERLIEEELKLGDHRNLFQAEVWPWHRPGKRNEIIDRYVSDLRACVTDNEPEHELLQLRSTVDEWDEPALKSLGGLAADAIEQTAFRSSCQRMVGRRTSCLFRYGS